MELLWPIIALGGLGLLFGLVLAFASKKFAVEIDPRVEQVRSVLPGANCGACGFPGCDGLAAAVAEGKAKPNACPVAGPEGAKKIAAILGVESNAGERQIARVKCQGSEGNASVIFDYEGLNDCGGAAEFASGNKSCRFACLGLGSCVRACKFDALRIENGIAVVDEEKCVSCGACVNACPKNIISLMPQSNPVFLLCRNVDMGKKVREVCLHGCITCNRCAKSCESGAITMVNSLPTFDYTKCTACGKCAEVCPTKSILKRVMHTTDGDEPNTEPTANNPSCAHCSVPN